MDRVRVLIVDDSVVVRRLLSEALASDPAIEVVGTAANGRIALQRIAQLNPDLITLDIEMPVMDGLTTLSELRKSYPRLPVIMFSNATHRGAVATLNALSLGARDYVTKPAIAGSIATSIPALGSELIPKIKALCRAGKTPQAPAVKGASAVVSAVGGSPRLRSQRFDCLAIGASTGGPNALAEVFRELPADLPVPVVIVQHMPPVFTKYLADRLSALSALPVREAEPGRPLVPGTAWLAPGNLHLAITRGADGLAIQVHQALHENSCRPSVDVLFRSVAQHFGAGALAVILTGMGQDGLRGCEAIRQADGRVVVQDEATSVVWGMPGAVVQAGLADLVLPLPRLAAELVTLAHQRRSISPGFAPSARA